MLPALPIAAMNAEHLAGKCLPDQLAAWSGII